MASTPTTPLLSSRSQTLFPALISVLVVVMLSVGADVGVTALSLTTVGVQHQFQLFGLILASAPQVALLLVIVAGLATLGGYRIAVRGSAIAAIAIGALYLALLLFFGLDFLQSRRMVPDANLKSFTLVGIKTAGFAGWFGLMLLWAGWRALQASHRTDDGDARGRGQSLIVGQD